MCCQSRKVLKAMRWQEIMLHGRTYTAGHGETHAANDKGLSRTTSMTIFWLISFL